MLNDTMMRHWINKEGSKIKLSENENNIQNLQDTIQVVLRGCLSYKYLKELFNIKYINKCHLLGKWTQGNNTMISIDEEKIHDRIPRETKNEYTSTQ